MPESSSAVAVLAPEQLRRLVSAIESLESERRTVAEEIKTVYDEAKSLGFDTGILRKVVRLRQKPVVERETEETLVETYERALKQGEL